MKLNVPRLMLAGTGSGCGKTTVTAGILSAFCAAGVDVRPYKCGPDYIDPMFHTHVTGVPSRNLDPWMLSGETVRHLMARSSGGADLVLIEGVMGLFDGLLNEPVRASSAELAAMTATPVVLIVNCKGVSLSAAAVIAGFRQFSPDVRIAAVILNRIQPAVYQMLKPQIEAMGGVPVAGFLPPLTAGTLESRHLGLVTPDGVADLDRRILAVAAAVSEHIDLALLRRLAAEAPPLDAPEPEASVQAREWGGGSPVRMGRAVDPAFGFYYQDNLDFMADLGVEWVPFSPMRDAKLPDDLDGLYLGGGYPEVFGDQLSENVRMLAAVQDFATSGRPLYAECGGYMYLCRSVTTVGGHRTKMTGVLEADVHMTEQLRRFGYVTLSARQDGWLCGAGTEIRAHEFHYSDSSDPGESFDIRRPNGRSWTGIHMTGRLFAGYPHIHFWANPVLCARLVRAMRQHRSAQNVRLKSKDPAG